MWRKAVNKGDVWQLGNEGKDGRYILTLKEVLKPKDLDDLVFSNLLKSLGEKVKSFPLI
jgi:hypothetical protein